MSNNPGYSEDLHGVAIIGMAGRFPEAQNIDEFWQNLVNGVECITFYRDEELIDAGIKPEVLENPDYVRAKGEVAAVDLFDADFFGINPREAEVTDPQHRMLLECAWEALEHAGYDSSKFEGRIGMYAGKSMDYYLLLNVFPQIKKEISAGSLQAAVGNDKDSLTTTIAYRLNLTGPAITIQTSSSTSLVAVSVACQSLLTYQCDIALAGGVTAGPPIRSGYKYEEGNIWSPDGHCRAFDAGAMGFVTGAGMGLATLKRLPEAAADGDKIWAVIKGFAVNNDGSNKVSYHAPSVDAQAEVVAEALAIADAQPDTIQYIETHGTGTHLGDPIEVTALTQAFRAFTGKKQFCAIGSVKTNIGHLDNAAGIAGLIKVALSLHYKTIVPSLHFDKPNPKIDFDSSPFFVNTRCREWPSDGTPRRGGVTSLGMGGTNAHVVLEEAPELESSGESRAYQLLLLSAGTESALENRTGGLLSHLQGHDDLNIADAAYTLAAGRRDLTYRRAFLCEDIEDARLKLEKRTAGWVFDGVCQSLDRPVVFMFSGQGAQYVNMGKELYLHEPVFKGHMDECAKILAPLLGLDVRELLYPQPEDDPERHGQKLGETWITQPVLFMLEYSLSKMWMEWGIKPVGMIGHSIGEYTAACIAGCMSLKDALKLVAIRGRLMQEQAKGAMLSVELGEAEIVDTMGKDLALAAVNSPKHGVVSGEVAAIESLEKALKERNIYCRRLHTSHAFHSAMMEPAKKAFTDAVSRLNLRGPEIPFISCVSGTWIRDSEVVSAQYWADQLRRPVRFADGIKEILNDSSRIFLEVGPGNGLCLLARQQQVTEGGIFSSIRHVKQTESDTAFLLKTLAHLWLAGVDVDWQGYYRGEARQRIPLPTYPFERKRFWLDGLKVTGEGEEIASPQAEEAGEIDQPKSVGEKKFQPRPEMKNEYATPTSDTEREVVEIWQDILGIKPIGIEDNFFDLGGHSLLATLFLSQLQEKFNIRLELRAIFESPTIATIVQQIELEKNRKDETANVEDILQEIEGLSQDEVQSALTDES